MKLTRLFTDSDQQSHFQKTEIELLDAPIGKITASIPCGEIIFGEIEDAQEIPWHNPLCKQLPGRHLSANNPAVTAPVANNTLIPSLFSKEELNGLFSIVK